jgi:hypothetical protein
VPVSGDIPAPALAYLRVAWLASPGGGELPMRLGDGPPAADSAAKLEVRLAAAPGAVPASAHPVDFRLGQQIQLTGYDLATQGAQVRVTFRWQALAAITQDYIVFAHLRDTPSHAYAQADDQPRQGAYPTRLWQAGEIILDPHLLALPAGRPTPPLDLYVGLVDARTGQRLAAYDAQGRAVPNNEIVLATGLVFP